MLRIPRAVFRTTLKEFSPVSIAHASPYAALPDFPQSALTAGEHIVLRAAAEKGGGFRGSVYVRQGPDGNGMVLSDGQTAYVIAHRTDSAPDPAILSDVPHQALLGRIPLMAGLEANYRLFPKDFAFCRDMKALSAPSLANGLSIVPVESDGMLDTLCALRADFFFEESGKRPEPRSLRRSLQETFRNIKPVLLLHRGMPAGMISSELHSSAGAMINMLYIAPHIRGNGYGSLLLRWYMNHLRQTSWPLCLFYSPGNVPAIRLYASMGFRKEEDWILGIKK